MAVTLTDNRTIITEADDHTVWSGNVTRFTVTADPTPVEATACIGQRNNNSTTHMYVVVAAVNFTAGQSPGPSLVYAWFFPRTVVDTLALGGMQILLGDGTNRIGFHLGGDDVAGFRHANGPTLWQCFVLDTSLLASYTQTVFAGTFAALNQGAITDFGVAFKATVGAQGNVPNTYVDIMRRGAVGVGVTITGGSSGDPGTFEEIAAADRVITNQKAHGVFRKLGAGMYGCQAPLTFGEASGSTASWFEEKNTVLVFESRGFATDKYRLVIQDNGVATATFKLGTKIGSGVNATGADGCTILVPPGVGGVFDAATDTDVTDVFIYGTRFSGFTAGVKFIDAHEFIGGIIDASGAIEVGGGGSGGAALFFNTSIAATTAAHAMLWNTTSSPDGKLDGTTFTKGSAASHGIRFDTNTPATFTMRNITLNSYGGTPGSNLVEDSGPTDAAIHNASGKALTITIAGGGSVPSVRNSGAGSTTTILQNAVTLTVTAKDVNTGSPIAEARVLVTAAAGGDLPADVTVTISQTGGVATVSHTNHGLITGNKVRIKNASPDAYNGVKTITVTGGSAYTYSIDSGASSPATGDIKSSVVLIDAETNGSGVASDTRAYTVNQPFVGKVAKGTGTNVYKTAPISDTVDKDLGFSLTAQLIPDA